MANYYVRSGAAGAGTGADWANAFTKLHTAINGKAAGDIFYVSEDHNETQAVSVAITSPGTLANPIQVYCVNHLGSVPPVSADLRTTAVINATGAVSYEFGSGYCSIVYGIHVIVGAGGFNSCAISFGQTTAVAETYWYFKKCLMEIASTNNNGNASIGLGTNDARWTAVTIFDDTQLKFNDGGANSQGLKYVGSTVFHWKNTAVAVAGTNFPSPLFTVNNPTGAWQEEIIFHGLGLQMYGAGSTIIGNYGTHARFQMRNCRVDPAATIGGNPSLITGRQEFVNYAGSAVSYVHSKFGHFGTHVVETAIVRGGGASDGTSPISYKIVTASDARPLVPFDSMPLSAWVDTVGSPVTVTVYGIWGGGAVPNNNDIWIEVEHMATVGYPLTSIASCGPADGLAVAAPLPSDVSAWGAGSTTKFKMGVTITPQVKGPIRVIVKAGKPSSTFYIDPLPVIVPPAAQATAFLARASGLDTRHASAYAAFIDGLVRDGVWPKLDLLYILGTQSAAIARLNLMSSSFTMTEIGSPTFTPDQGYTGGVGKGLSTNWIPATHAVNYQLFNSSFGVRDNTSRGKDTVFPIGCNSSTMHFLNWCTVAANFLTRHDSSGEVAAINGGTSSKGFFVSNRTDSVNVEGFQDGVSIGAGTQHNAAGGFALATDVLMVLSTNSGTGITGVPAGETTDQLSLAFAGASMSAALQAAFAARIATLGATLGWP